MKTKPHIHALSKISLVFMLPLLGWLAWGTFSLMQAPLDRLVPLKRNMTEAEVLEKIELGKKIGESFNHHVFLTSGDRYASYYPYKSLDDKRFLHKQNGESFYQELFVDEYQIKSAWDDIKDFRNIYSATLLRSQFIIAAMLAGMLMLILKGSSVVFAFGFLISLFQIAAPGLENFRQGNLLFYIPFMLCSLILSLNFYLVRTEEDDKNPLYQMVPILGGLLFLGAGVFVMIASGGDDIGFRIGKIVVLLAMGLIVFNLKGKKTPAKPPIRKKKMSRATNSSSAQIKR
jgi:hypothetical protein